MVSIKQKKKSLISAKISNEEMTCLCTDRKVVPIIMQTNFGQHGELKGNAMHLHCFPRVLKVNDDDYKVALERKSREDRILSNK